MSGQLTLTTPRLTLRRFRPDDAPVFHAIFSDPRAMRYWSTPPHTTPDQTRAWIAQTIRATTANTADEFVVERAGLPIGKVGLWRPHEIGLIFSPHVWRQGYAREAAQALIARSFQHNVPSITADVDPRNTPSLRLLHSLGFTQTHTATHTTQVGTEWVDSTYLQLLPPSYSPA